MSGGLCTIQPSTEGMMATKKTPSSKQSPPASAGQGLPLRQKNVLSLKGTERWKEWLDGLAAKKGMPVTVLVDHSLRELAKREGYPDPPERIP